VDLDAEDPAASFDERLVIDAGSGSGILRLRRKIPLLFFEIRVQTGCLAFHISITALKVTRSVCLRAF